MPFLGNSPPKPIRISKAKAPKISTLSIPHTSISRTIVEVASESNDGDLNFMYPTLGSLVKVDCETKLGYRGSFGTGISIII